MDRLAFDPHPVYQHGLVYTALSRVKTIETLYLIHKVQHHNFTVSHKVNKEMDRLRNQAQWKLQHSLPFLSPIDFILCSLNTRSLPLHAKEIIHDHDFLKATILCFQETRDKTHVHL